MIFFFAAVQRIKGFSITDQMLTCFVPSNRAPCPRFDVAALNFRGCSGELGKYPLGYHLGFTDDLLHVVSTA